MYSSLIRPGGLLLTDRYYVHQEKKVDARQVELEMYTEVLDKIGRPIVLNVCMLGALISLVPLVSRNSIVNVLETRIPANVLEVNKQALALGTNLAENFKKERGILSIQLW